MGYILKKHNVVNGNIRQIVGIINQIINLTIFLVVIII